MAASCAGGIARLHRHACPAAAGCAWGVPVQPALRQPCRRARTAAASSSSAADGDASPTATLDALPPLGASLRGSSSSSSSSSSAVPQQLSAAAAAGAAADEDSEDVGYMREYAALKQQLLDNTRKSGAAVGLYLLLTVNGAAALAAMVGTAASYAYCLWLCRDVDAVQPTDRVPVWEANKIDSVLLRRAAKLGAAYQAALRPRLLVPASLGVLVGVAGSLNGGPLPLVYQGSLLLGFLSYKAALIVKLVDDLTPKSFSEASPRPTVERFDDELDQWGRPRKRLATPIDAMPADQQAKAYEALDKQLEKEARRSGRGA